MATPLKLSHVFGLKADVKSNLHYLDELEVIYPAGRNIVCYNLEKKTQRFLPGDPSNGPNSQITAMALYNAKQRYLAVAETGDKAIVSVYDVSAFTSANTSARTSVLNRKRALKARLVCPEVTSLEYISLSFSPDGKQLLAQSGGPDWLLVNFLWGKGKILQIAPVSNQAGAPVHQCSYCPSDPSCVSVTGKDILRFLRVEPIDFKAISFSIGKNDFQNYVCHTWVDDRILVGTDTGDILVFEDAEFRGVLKSSPSNGKSINSIVAFSKGFVCGCEEGVLYIFERDEKEIYKESKSFQIDSNYVKISNLCISPSEDNVACSLENGQAFVLSLSSTDILKADEMNFEPLAVSFHHGAITGLDVCVRKPLVVTCGVDKSVRVWNYQERSLEALKVYKDQPLAVSFHPSGLNVLVSFNESVCLVNLLMDELRTYHELPVKHCNELAYCHGGQMFALANGYVINVYSTDECELLYTLRGHKAKINSIRWRGNDNGIYSCGIDGIMFEWRLADNEHQIINQYDIDDTSLLSLAPQDDALECHLIGNDHCLRSFKGGKEIANIQTNIGLTQIALPNYIDNLLFAGTDAGSVCVFELPLSSSQHHSIDCHGSRITSVAVSPHDHYVISAGMDGCLSLFEIDKSLRNIGRETLYGYGFSEEILITRSDMKEKLTLMNELYLKVDDLKEQNKVQLQEKELKYQEKLREATEKFNHELEVDKGRFDSLEHKKSEMEMQYTMAIDQLTDDHTNQLRGLEKQHKEKIAMEQTRFKELHERLESQRKLWKAEEQEEEEAHRRAVQELESRQSRELERERQRRRELEADKEHIIDEFEETKILLEEDADREIDSLKTNYDARLTVERMQTLRLKEENTFLRTRYMALKRDIEEHKEQIKIKEDKQKMLYDQIKSLERDGEGAIKEIRERDATINDKFKRIFELRKKNQELEKFKFVLRYKIKELKRQIKPSQEKIEEMGEQMAQMEAELKDYEQQSLHSQLGVKDLSLKLQGMEKEIETQVEGRTELEQDMQGIRVELQEVYQRCNDPKAVKEGVKALYQRYVTGETKTAKIAETPTASDHQLNYKRQQTYLEKNLDALKQKFDKDMRVHKKDNQRIIQENMLLIKEINRLRREMQLVRQHQRQQQQPPSTGQRTLTYTPTAPKGRNNLTTPAQVWRPKSRPLTTAESDVVPFESYDTRDAVSPAQARLQKLIETQQEQIRALQRAVQHAEGDGGSPTKPSSKQLKYSPIRPSSSAGSGSAHRINSR